MPISVALFSNCLPFVCHGNFVISLVNCNSCHGSPMECIGEHSYIKLNCWHNRINIMCDIIIMKAIKNNVAPSQNYSHSLQYNKPVITSQ